MTSLARFIAEAGLTQEELSWRSGIDRSVINKLATGRTKIKSRGGVLAALAYGLGCNASDLADIAEREDIIPLGSEVTV